MKEKKEERNFFQISMNRFLDHPHLIHFSPKRVNFRQTSRDKWKVKGNYPGTWALNRSLYIHLPMYLALLCKRHTCVRSLKAFLIHFLCVERRGEVRGVASDTIGYTRYVITRTSLVGDPRNGENVVEWW